MNIITTKGILLGAGLLSALTLTTSLSPAFAKPRSKAATKAARQDVKEARRDVQQERRDVRQADTPQERRQEQQDLNRAQRDLQREQAQLRNQKQQTRPGYNGNRPGYNNGRNSNRPGYNTRPGYSRPGYSNGGYNNGGYGQSYTGRVTQVRSNQSFDVTINGNTFNVYTTRSVPRGLSVGDVVRINGIRQDNNDIRNATVSLITNR